MNADSLITTMKRREFIRGIVSVTLATATASLSGPTVAGAMGSQIRKGVHRKLRDEEEAKEDTDEQAIKESKEKPEEKAKEDPKEEAEN